MSSVVLYRGVPGEAIGVPAGSSGRRAQFPVAELADRLGGEADRKALGVLSYKHPYAEVLAFRDRQKRRVADGRPHRPAPARYCGQFWRKNPKRFIHISPRRLPPIWVPCHTRTRAALSVLSKFPG